MQILAVLALRLFGFGNLGICHLPYPDLLGGLLSTSHRCRRYEVNSLFFRTSRL